MLESVCVEEAVVHVGVAVCTCGSVCAKCAHTCDTDDERDRVG